MYVDSWERNHQFYLIEEKELLQSLAHQCYTHYFLIGEFDVNKIRAVCPEANVFCLPIKPTDTFGWEDIDDILIFVGEAFVEDYKFDMAICSQNKNRVISAYIIAKHSTVGENGRYEKSYLEKLNPEKDNYDKQMIKAYSEATGNIALQEICNKIWRKNNGDI